MLRRRGTPLVALGAEDSTGGSAGRISGPKGGTEIETGGLVSSGNPPSARRKASCTRLIVSPRLVPRSILSVVAGIVIEGRPAHGDGPDDNGDRPGQPMQAPFSPAQQRVFEQRNAAQHGQVSVCPDILQVLQRRVLHLLAGGQHHA